MPRRITSSQPPLTPIRRHHLRAWRQNTGLSMDKVVAIVGDQVDSFSKASLSRMETYKQPYSQPVLEALAPIYGCLPGDLLNVAPKTKTWEVIAAIRQIKSDDIAHVARIAATFPKAP